MLLKGLKYISSLEIARIDSIVSATPFTTISCVLQKNLSVEFKSRLLRGDNVVITLAECGLMDHSAIDHVDNEAIRGKGSAIASAHEWNETGHNSTCPGTCEAPPGQA